MADNFKVGHNILGFLLSTGKAFFNALVSVAWGIASFFLLIALIGYYKVDASAIQTLLNLVLFVEKNWGVFFFILFLWEFIVDYKEFLRPVLQSPTIQTQTAQTPTKKEVKL